MDLQCFRDKIELSSMGSFFFFKCFWWNKKLGYKKENKISRLSSLYILVCNLVLALWEGTSAVLYMPNGSVELVCSSAGVCLELALAPIQPVSHLDFVMSKRMFYHIWLGLELWFRGSGAGF